MSVLTPVKKQPKTTRKAASPGNFGVNEFALANGLKVLHRFDTGTPTVAVCVVYHVGSRNEAVGHTGSTHILEHLLFKDSENFNKENGKPMFAYLEWSGGLLNATTWNDRTHYFELMAKEKVESALAVEADRMRNSLFSEADLAAEMTVVRNEYERGRNNPFELLEEQLWATAFNAHPYHHPTIGWKDDIEHATAAKLREFYNRFYHPDNATLLLVGDLSLRDAKKLAEKYFGSIPHSKNPIPEMYLIEPEQEGARYFELRKPGATSATALAYKIPAGTDVDFPAVMVLAQLLGGGRSSRLYRKLVDTGRAADVSVSAFPFRDPGLLIASAHAADGAKPESLLALMRNECEKITAEKKIDAKEVSRAKESLKSQFAFSRDGNLAEIRTLTEAIACGDWRLAYAMEEKIDAVSAADVARVAKKYLVQYHETAGILTTI